MIHSLDEAVGAGEPLIEIVVMFKEGVNYDLATAAVNALGPDVELHPGHWYGSSQLRVGCLTAEGARRLFDADFRRVPYPPGSGFFRWTSTKILKWPDEIAPYVQSITASQPGADDDGQPYVPRLD
jgi:hypothetical protein